ncbi:MAG TPA: MaoC family dehydratase [Bryobacteraceae bacterium]|jgi:acyl dehydratase|nr:MaoC family dehydratase [Bryobacteraceae bacterium]
MTPVKTLDDLRGFAGREIAVTDWLAITQERIDKFADATGDHQWIHTNRERAQRESPYGGTIAHGFLTLSLMPQFLKEAIQLDDLRMAINYGLNRVRFPSAVPADSRIRARIALKSIRDIEDATEATFLITIEAPDSEKPCCVAEWLARYYQ